MLHGPFALDGCGNFLVPFRVDEPGQVVPLGEPFNQALAVFLRPARDVAGHAEIERAVGSIGHDVDPAAARSHAPMLQAVDARIKSGHDEVGGRRAHLVGRPHGALRHDAVSARPVPYLVMAALVAAFHVAPTHGADMDARNKSAHDGVVVDGEGYPQGYGMVS